MSDQQAAAPAATPDAVIVPVPVVVSKKPWQSKTLLINGILGLVTFASLMIPQAHVVSDYINSHGSQIGMFWSVINMVLRAVTSDKISLDD